MPAYLFENHTNQKVVHGQYFVDLAHLDLPAGSYMVWAKLSLGVTVEAGIPLPPAPYARGVALLSFGDSEDQVNFGLRPASSENNAALSMMCAAGVNTARRARLMLLNFDALPVYCNRIKLMALQVDSLEEHQIGVEALTAPEDAVRDALIAGKAVPRGALEEFLKKA